MTTSSASSSGSSPTSPSIASSGVVGFCSTASRRSRSRRLLRPQPRMSGRVSRSLKMASSSSAGMAASVAWALAATSSSESLMRK